MGSFAFAVQVLTDHTLFCLRHDGIRRRQYEIFSDAVADYLCSLHRRWMRSEYIGPFFEEAPQRFGKLVSVCIQLGTKCMAEGTDEGNPVFVHTWRFFADTLRNAITGELSGVHVDEFWHFKVAMFAKYVSSQLNAPLAVVRQRRRALATGLVDFIVSSMT